jgi:hypothetical protein
MKNECLTNFNSSITAFFPSFRSNLKINIFALPVESNCIRESIKMCKWIFFIRALLNYSASSSQFQSLVKQINVWPIHPFMHAFKEELWQNLFFFNRHFQWLMCFYGTPICVDAEYERAMRKNRINYSYKWKEIEAN